MRFVDRIRDSRTKVRDVELARHSLEIVHRVYGSAEKVFADIGRAMSGVASGAFDDTEHS